MKRSDVKIAPLEIPGVLAIAIHMVGTPGNDRCALHLDVAQHSLDVESLVHQRSDVTAIGSLTATGP